jgi:cysteine-rich repeat protein
MNTNRIRNALLVGLALTSMGAFEETARAQGNPPERCAGYGNLQSVSLTTFNSGLGGWTAGAHDVANPATFDTPDWAVDDDLPDGRAGGAAFVPNLDIGDCGADDESGALSLDSPTIVIPGSADVPRISFHNWFQTEFGWDGGNLKISVNGGPFQVVPSSAFEFGAYSGTLYEPTDEFGVIYNSNPLADQAAFTGTHDGQSDGDWVDTRINLLGIAEAGDSIRIRFDFGVDACGGEVGWYVDDVEVYRCQEELPPSDCGNGVLDAGEQCDDGNDFVDDGCSNICQVETGWQCTDPDPPGGLDDPGFEAGTPNPFWDESSDNNFGTPICSVGDCGRGAGTGPSAGEFWAWFGGLSRGVESLVSQSVLIPDTATELTFDLEIPVCDSAADYVEVLIDGNRAWSVDGASGLCGDDGYVRRIVDITGYADGQDHDLELHSETFGSNGGVSNFFIDELAIPGTPSMCTPLAPSLTLVKVVINDDGGTATPSNWALQASGPTTFSGAGPSVSSGPDFEPGTYDLHEGGGPAGYVASAWVCEGGDQIDANTVVMAPGESATCTITNDDVPGGFVINAGHSGAWFNPDTSGQGQFIDVEPDEKFMFISWFTYTDEDSANPFLQRWLTAQGNYSGNLAELTLYETLGGQFDNPQDVQTTAIGTVSLRFDDCDLGEMTYDIEDEGLQGSFPLQRVIPGSGDTCQSLVGNSVQSVDINAGMDGAWFEPATSGQGFFMDALPDPEGGGFLFVSWFTYGDDSASGLRWLTAQGNFDGPTAQLDLNETTGGSFDDPRPPSTVKVGTMTIDFTDCANAVLDYSFDGDGIDGVIALERVVPGTEALCQTLVGAE